MAGQARLSWNLLTAEPHPADEESRRIRTPGIIGLAVGAMEPKQDKMLEWPRRYSIVRQGQHQTVTVDGPEALIELRTELELVRRFGAGATPTLIAAFDRRIEQIRRPHQLPVGPDEMKIEALMDMRAILSDSLSPVNRRTVARIDQESPEVKAGVAMSSIEKDAKEFREDVAKELNTPDDEDVDAVLAELAQAEAEADPEPTQAADAESAPQESARSELDEDLEALIANATHGEMDDSALGDLAAAIEASDSSNEEDSQPDTGVTPPSKQDMEGPEPTSEAPGIEEVTEQMADTLTAAETQLDAIASAFEEATAELGQASGGSSETSEAESAPNSGEQAGDREAPWPVSSSPEPGRPEASSVVGGAHGSAIGQMRLRLQQARAKILSEVDDLLVLVQRVDQMQARANQAARNAREFEQAAARAQQAAQSLAAAEAEAAKARADFEQAQSRAAAARQAWEQAQQDISA